MPSMLFGSTPAWRSATIEEAPQSTRIVEFAASRRKQVLKRPPEPNASPEPMTVRRMSRRRARALRHLGVPALDVDHAAGHPELGGLHQVDRDQGLALCDAVMVAG